MRNSAKGESIYSKFSSGKPAAEPSRSASSPKTKPVEYQQLQHRPAPQPSFSEETAPTKVSVHIAGMQYRLVAPDKKGESYVRAIAEKADQLIMQIQKNAPGMSMTSITVLSLVNVMDELQQKDMQIRELNEKLTQASTAQEADKANFTHLREINWELKKEVLRLQSVIDSYEKDDEENYEAAEKHKLLPLEELVYDTLGQEELDDSEEQEFDDE